MQPDGIQVAGPPGYFPMFTSSHPYFLATSSWVKMRTASMSYNYSKQISPTFTYTCKHQPCPTVLARLQVCKIFTNICHPVPNPCMESGHCFLHLLLPWQVDSKTSKLIQKRGPTAKTETELHTKSHQSQSIGLSVSLLQPNVKPPRVPARSSLNLRNGGRPVRR